MKSLMKTTGLGVFCALWALTAPAADQSANEVFERARAPVAAEAVVEEGLVEIGGIRQWISVRGRHAFDDLLDGHVGVVG